MINSANQNFTASDKWKLLGHLLFSAGTLCLSISSLLNLAKEGALSDDPYQKKITSDSSGREQAFNYFGRS